MTETEKPKLLPCPFCGSTHIVVIDDDDERYPYVQCCDCNTSTDVSPTKEEAVEWWNHRAVPQWSQEPPDEDGWYLACCNDGTYRSVAKIGDFITEPTNRKRGLSIYLFIEKYQPQWQKITPPLRGACCTKESTMNESEGDK